MEHPKEDKIATTVYIEKRIKDHIEQNLHFKNISEWINKRYPEEFLNLDKEIKQLEKLTQETESCKSRIRLLKEQKEKSLIPPKAYSWIKNVGLDRVKLYQKKSVLRHFNDKFNLKLNKNQFDIYIKQAEDEKIKETMEAK